MPTSAKPISEATHSVRADSKRPSVAIVDDDSGFAGYVRTFLALRGFDARAYARGDEIVAALANGEPLDIVLLDVAMPGMDGLETLKALKVARPGLQVIMLSGREQAPTIVEAVRLGAADYVVKPDDPEGLGEIALEAAIRRAARSIEAGGDTGDLRRQSTDGENEAFAGWGESAAMREVAHIVRQVADSDVTVLIRGESGVGKELVARAIHQCSTRSQKPFVKVNCAALPGELLESELFGHERGAFTGAATTQVGKFEQANLGTIFLDEIAEIPPELQAKLLHVLQDAEFTRLGSNKKIDIDVRVVAATNRNLEAMIADGGFREDLYYRLKVIEAVVPSLRERPDEIAHLADLFIARYAERYNRPASRPTDRLRARLMQYHWPGNVRELENVIKRFVILQDEEGIVRELERAVPVTSSGPMPVARGAAEGSAAAPPAAPSIDAPAESSMADENIAAGAGEHRGLPEVAREAALAAERRMISETLRHVRWNRREAADALGVSYKTLLSKIKQAGIEQPF